MNPLYHQLFGVIGVILVLGSLGILRAMVERQDRETSSLRERMETLGPANEEGDSPPGRRKPPEEIRR